MASSDYKQQNYTANFTPVSENAVALDYLDRVVLLGRANFPKIDSLKIGMAALIDDEFMHVTAIAPGQVSVSRGCADTVPARHAPQTLIWFMDRTTVGTDMKEHSAGETNAIKYSPFTNAGPLDIETTAPDTVTYNWRFFRPYPPGQMRVNGDRWYAPHAISSNRPTLTLTWAHRDRKLEADQLVDHDAGNIGPEPGTTYTARIYDAFGNLKRTEVGIMSEVHDSLGQLIPPSWTYTWLQAMADLELGLPTPADELAEGVITLHATRDGFDSWQGYEIKFTINKRGQLLTVGQYGELVAQVTGAEPGTPPDVALYSAQFAAMAAQAPGPDDPGGEGVVAADGMYVAQISTGAGQKTSFYTSLNRNLFEAPYALLAKRGDDTGKQKLVTVVARPSDRLTDSHTIKTRFDYPQGSGEALPFNDTVPNAPFTPWISTANTISYLDTTVAISTSSFYDGIPLSDVHPGQVALIGAEFVRIESVDATTVVIARGCYDTIPAQHGAGSRMWFFEARAGHDPTAYPLVLSNNVLGSAAQVKMVPDVYGPPLDLNDVPTDRLNMLQRTERPYPPGQVTVNDTPWFNGAIPSEGQSVVIRWVNRNRLLQGASAVDHLAAEVPPEDQQKYRLKLTIWIYPDRAPSYPVTIREEIVDGTMFEYTWEMAKTDGYRAGQLLRACGYVTVGMWLETVRFGTTSWQGYTIPLLLPSYTCPPGRPPGGNGQLPPGGGNGNGDVNTDPGGGSTPGGDDQGDGPPDPIDNGGGIDDGNGPPEPPKPPVDWPDPVEPPPEPDPGDPNPALKAHWDLNWDRHWDAYNKDNPGDN